MGAQNVVVDAEREEGRARVGGLERGAPSSLALVRLQLKTPDTWGLEEAGRQQKAMLADEK